MAVVGLTRRPFHPQLFDDVIHKRISHQRHRVGRRSWPCQPGPVRHQQATALRGELVEVPLGVSQVDSEEGVKVAGRMDIVEKNARRPRRTRSGGCLPTQNP